MALVNPAVVVPLVTIIVLLAWAVGFVSGALWFWSRWERERELLREGDIGAGGTIIFDEGDEPRLYRG